MTDDTKRSLVFLSIAVLFLAFSAVLSACQVEDWIEVEVPADVASAIGSREKIAVSQADSAWEDWQAWVQLESKQFARSIDEGWGKVGTIRSLTELGIQIGSDTAASFPGGALIASGLAMAGGLFLRRPGDKRRMRVESDKAYNDGLQKGQRISQSMLDAMEALRDQPAESETE